MRQFIIPIFFLLLFSSCDKTDNSRTLLQNATVFDGNGTKMEQANILIEGGIIVDVYSEEKPVPKNTEVVDLQGKFVAPGLVDAHVHFFQTGFFDSRPDAADLRDSLPYQEVYEYQRDHPERYYEAYLRSGITAVYDVGGFPWSIDFQEQAEKNLSAPHVAAAGTLITPFPQEYLTTFNVPGDTVIAHMTSLNRGKQIAAEMTQLGATGIKIWGIPARDTTFHRELGELATEIRSLGNQMIVHATNLTGAKVALEHGASLLVHSVSDVLIDNEFVDLLKSNDAIYTPTMIVSDGYVKTYLAMLGDEFEMIDPNGVVDAITRDLLNNAIRYSALIDTTNFRERYESALATSNNTLAYNLRKVYEEGGLIAVGTDAGNPGTLHGISFYDEIEAMQEAGIPPAELIVMATRNGALAMNRLDDFGTLEKGKMADLIILESDPSLDIANLRTLTHVMRGGKIHSVSQPFVRP